MSGPRLKANWNAANAKQTVVTRNGLCEGCSVLSECLYMPLGTWAIYVHM
jgi:hypothetical protein